MIPLLLEIQAFGPFAKQQTIDFSELNDSRLFLISGQTGSGKTTIFDAITYALFGQPSGSIRNSDGLKSHFADESIVCFVRFSFVVKGETFTVYREPPQSKIKRNGQVSKSLPVAELSLADNEIIGSINAVNEKIKAIIGIDCDQFRKIAMLPQGEFRRFLSEKTSDKQNTLREIFKTEQLNFFIKKLDEKVKECKQKLNDINNITQGSINNISCIHNQQLGEECEKGYANLPAIISMLEQDNSRLNETVQSGQRHIQSLETKLNGINLPYYREVNQSFDKLEAEREKQKKLDSDALSFIELQSKIVLLNKINMMIPLINQSQQAKTALDEFYSELERHTKERDILRVTRLNVEPLYQTAYEKTKTISTTLEEIVKLKQKCETLNLIEQLNNQLTNFSNEQITAVASKARLTKYVEMLDLLNSLESIKLMQDKLSKAIDLTLKCNDIQVEYLSISDEYKRAFNTFLSCQAALLSVSLKNGVPCPVCGSAEHPYPATQNGDRVTQVELDDIKQKFDNITKQVEQTVKNRDISYNALDIVDCNIDTLKSMLIKVNDYHNNLKLSLENYADLDKNVTIDKVQAKLNAVELAIIKLEQNILNITSQAESCQAKLDENDDKSTVLSNISKLQSYITETNLTYEQLSTQLNEINADVKANSVSIEQTNGYIISQKSHYDVYSQKLSLELDKSSLTLENIKLNSSFISNIEKYELSLKSYQNECIAVKASTDTLLEQLKDKTQIDITKLQQQYDEISDTIRQATQALTSVTSILSQNKSIYSSIITCLDNYKKTMKRYDELNEIFSVANGSKSDKITFESYILSYYFNQVIENANIRLAQMTNKRYTIFIRQEKEKYGAYSGLELNVLDSYTGKQRDVATLSGGESFKLALSLSLGLADITSQHSGGIEINTLFIDEGFGSLDSDSISSAIECLNSLQLQGRYVGVISHVAELKEKIASKILVNQTPTGSYLKSEF